MARFCRTLKILKDQFSGTIKASDGHIFEDPQLESAVEQEEGIKESTRESKHKACGN
jgi:hypothetical protein